MAVIEAVFGFLQVQIKRMSGHPVELHQTSFGIASKALNAVDMRTAPSKLIAAVVAPQVLVNAHIDQAVISAPTVGVNHACNIGLAPDDGLKDGLRSIGDDLAVHTLASLEQSKNHCLATCPTAPKTTHPARPEVRLIGLELALQERHLLAVLGKPATYTQMNAVDRAHRDGAELGAIGGRQVHRKVTQDLTKLGLADFRMSEIPVFLNHDGKRSLAVDKLCFLRPFTAISTRCACAYSQFN